MVVLLWFLEPGPSARCEERTRLSEGWWQRKSHLRIQRAWPHLPCLPGFPRREGRSDAICQPLAAAGRLCFGRSSLKHLIQDRLSHKEVAGCLWKALGPRGQEEQIRTWACPPRPLHPGSQQRGRLHQRALDWKHFTGSPEKGDYPPLLAHIVSPGGPRDPDLSPGSPHTTLDSGVSMSLCFFCAWNSSADVHAYYKTALSPLVLRARTEHVSTPEPYSKGHGCSLPRVPIGPLSLSAPATRGGGFSTVS